MEGALSLVVVVAGAEVDEFGGVIEELAVGEVVAVAVVAGNRCLELP